MADSVIDQDRAALNELGYAQELKRGMGGFSNFAISFSIISILAGGMTSYWLGMVTSAARWSITLGWIIVGFFVLLVGMAMGEICSAYPTAGGLYFWSAKLARKNAPLWSWFTGWFNFIGQIGVIASVDYALAIFIGYFITHVRQHTTFGDTLDGRGRSTSSSSRRCSSPTVCSTRSASNSSGCSATSACGGTSSASRSSSPCLFIAPGQTDNRYESVSSTARTDSSPAGPARASSCVYMFFLGLLLVAVHDHRIRRLGARERGDGRRSHRGAEGDRAGDLRVGDRRVLPQHGDYLALRDDRTTLKRQRRASVTYRHHAARPLIFDAVLSAAWRSCSCSSASSPSSSAAWRA